MIIGNSPAAPSDLIRQLVNLAVNAGRSLQSSQTGFVHLCYRLVDYPTHDTIPLYENFLFALALMRERTAESFAEGKGLIEKLLHFQSMEEEQSGNFPVYLHEYPLCKDRNVAAHLLPIFYWILRTFPVVLGSPLRDRFQVAAERLVDCCLRLRQERPQFIVSLKIACALKALGVLWQRADLEAIADQWLNELLAQTETPEFFTWFLPSTAGEALVALEMVYPNLEESPWASLWNHMVRFWHTKTATYAGPGYRDHQFASQPEVILLDLVVGFHTGEYSYRALLNGPHLLQGALIHPTDEKLQPIQWPAVHQGLVAGRKWHFFQEDNRWAYSALEKHRADPSTDNTYSALRVIWGDLNNAHTFICQGGNLEKVAYDVVEGGIDLIFTLPEEIPNEVRQKNREVMFFFDASEDASLKVSGIAAATSFQLGEVVDIKSAGMQLSLCFRSEKGECQLFGHIAKGNRPSQKHTSGDGRFKAYDWQIFLRTVGREACCVLRAEIRFNHGEIS